MASTPVSISPDMLLVWARRATPRRRLPRRRPRASIRASKRRGTTRKSHARQHDGHQCAVGQGVLQSERQSVSRRRQRRRKKTVRAVFGPERTGRAGEPLRSGGVTAGEQTRLAAAFDSGMRQLQSFLSGTKFSALTMTPGRARDTGAVQREDHGEPAHLSHRRHRQRRSERRQFGLRRQSGIPHRREGRRTTSPSRSISIWPTWAARRVR